MTEKNTPKLTVDVVRQYTESQVNRRKKTVLSQLEDMEEAIRRARRDLEEGGPVRLNSDLQHVARLMSDAGEYNSLVEQLKLLEDC